MAVASLEYVELQHSASLAFAPKADQSLDPEWHGLARPCQQYVRRWLIWITDGSNRSIDRSDSIPPKACSTKNDLESFANKIIIITVVMS